MTWKDRQRHREKARDHLIRAAAALTEYETGSLSFALLETLLGTLNLIKADHKDEALETVTEWLKKQRAEEQ